MGKYSDLLSQDLGQQPSAPRGRFSAQLATDLASKPSAAAPAKAAPADNVSTLLNALPFGVGKDLEQAGVGDALRGYQKTLMDAPHGIAQFVENAVGSAAGALSTNPVSRAIQSTVARDNAAMMQRQNQYQASITHPAAASVGEIAGNVMPFLAPTGAASLLKSGGGGVGRLAAKTPLIGKALAPVADAATQGAMVGAATPVTGVHDPSLSDQITGNQPTDYWSQFGQNAAVGGAVGSATGGVAGAASALYDKFGRPIRAMVNPSGTAADTFANLLADGDAQRAQQLGAALRGGGYGPSELVPGSQPTLAELAGNPNIVRIQKVLGNRPELSDLFLNRQNANNAARWQAINNVAQDEPALVGAIDARRSAMQPQVESLLTNGNPVNVDPVRQAIQSTQQSAFGVDPVINRGLNDVKSTLAQRALPAPEAPPAILDASGNPLRTAPPSPTMMMPDQLDAVRQNLRNYIADNASNGAVASKQEAGLEPIKNAITDSIESANPGYRAYLASYAQHSVPINTMEAGQSIAADLGNRAFNAVGDTQLTLTGYRTALGRALKAAPYGIDPAAQSALEGVQNDLQRASIINSQASAYGGGSATSPNLLANDWLGAQLSGAPPGTGSLIFNQLGKFIPGVGPGLEKWNQTATQRSAAALAELLLNPTTSGATALDNYANGTLSQPMLDLFNQLPGIPNSLNYYTRGTP